MNECKEVRGLLALPRTDWSDEDRRRVEAHLAGCEECRSTARAYADQDRWSRTMPPVTLMPAQRSQLLNRVRQADRGGLGKSASARGSVPQGVLAGVVGLVLIALLTLVIRGLARPASDTGGRLTPAASGAVTPQAPDQAGTTAVVPAPVVTAGQSSNLGRLAYVLDGDVWIRALPEGEPLRLTDDGRNSEPRWSPSGEWLAYRQDTQVWLVRADGRDAQPVDSGAVVNSFAWSPVEDRLAFVSGSGVLRLAVVRAGETEPAMLLPPNPEGQPGAITWSPDGTSIAYEWREAMDYQGLWQIPAAGGEPRELYASGLPQRGEALLAGWSSDGRFLLFWQGDIPSASLVADGLPFYALPAAGGDPRLLAGGDDVVLYHRDFWSSAPAGPSLALTVGAGRETWANKRVVLADPQTGQLTAVSGQGLAAFSPVLSAGGLAYVAGPDVGFVGGGDPAQAAVRERHVWAVAGEGAAPRQLTADPAYRDERPLWSADGSYVLFVRVDEEGRVSLWLLPAAGGDMAPVAEGLGPLPGLDPSTGPLGYYGHLEWDSLFDWWQGAAGTAVPAGNPPSEPAGATPGVARLLQDPPVAGETVELDAYFSVAGSSPMRGGPPPLPDQVFCPTSIGWAAALTDRPFLGMLRVLNGSRSNTLPQDGAWLVATTPEATQPGRSVQPQLPYLGRFRGHLGDPALDHCPNADRILVVEEVVTIYQEQPPASAGEEWALPDDHAAWPRYAGPALPAAAGYSLPYPPDWVVEPVDEPGVISAVALRGPQWPSYPVVVRVHDGETVYDQYEPAALPPLLQGPGFGVYEQGWAFGQPVEGAGLSGFTVDRSSTGAGQAAVLFSANGYTYELALTYPTGFDASQALLTIYTALVEGFRLNTPPGPTPTPPVNQALGPGPFLSAEETMAEVRVRDGQEVELLDAVLVSEAAARQQAGVCSSFSGHPGGVWLLTVRGPYEGMTRTLKLFLDATTGEQLCGEEVMPPGTEP